MDAQAIVARLIQGWETLDVDAITACLAPDAVWHSAIGRFLQGMDSAAFTLRRQAEIAAGAVPDDRVDVFRRKDGTGLSIPVIGCFEIRDGLVAAWRDYLDAGVMKG